LWFTLIITPYLTGLTFETVAGWELALASSLETSLSPFFLVASGCFATDWGSTLLFGYKTIKHVLIMLNWQLIMY
jgi:hypothetical protein